MKNRERVGKKKKNFKLGGKPHSGSPTKENIWRSKDPKSGKKKKEPQGKGVRRGGVPGRRRGRFSLTTPLLGGGAAQYRFFPFGGERQAGESGTKGQPIVEEGRGGERVFGER